MLEPGGLLPKVLEKRRHRPTQIALAVLRRIRATEACVNVVDHGGNSTIVSIT